MAQPLPGKWRICGRSRKIPRHWQRITPQPGIENYVQRRDWQLVLNAADIPYILVDGRYHGQIYAPPLWADLAKAELRKYLEENRGRGHIRRALPLYRHPFSVLLFLLPLIFIHAVNSGWWIGPDWLPGRGVWTAAGSIDNFNIRFYGQWQRIFTALTLHADLRHLSGNLLFGAIFLVLLARAVGPGRAILLTILGGAAGNALSLLVHLPGYRSLGFSTAIFASLGCAAIMQAQAGGGLKKAGMALGAALGLLALLGMEGENTDWAAHVMGLGAGAALGALCCLAQKRGIELPGQLASAVLAIGLETAAWLMAFQRADVKIF